MSAAENDRPTKESRSAVYAAELSGSEAKKNIVKREDSRCRCAEMVIIALYVPKRWSRSEASYAMRVTNAM